MSTRKYEPHGRREVVFVQGGKEFRRTWATIEERAAIIMQMVASGMSTKTIARAFGLSPWTVQADLQKRGVGIFDLRKRKQDGVRTSILPETMNLVNEFAVQRGLFFNSAIHSLVLAGLKSLSQKETDDA